MACARQTKTDGPCLVWGGPLRRRMLKQQLAQPAIVPWWQQINGVFAATPAFDEAIHLGRQYREAQRPPEGFAVINASGSN
ncbi:hypothetical protein CJ255_12255 [Candidatus Viridilinea mediisalina]|uniref:Uncharacterized protein n=2 Tax=Candidatus Viridilinea mediisalina TaxID=2024553 RepID=A0A2A6RIW6_9CHLR|nr:hypothetical protein CJ255_12255 [Candidatus Viridilinea mediisalina]